MKVIVISKIISLPFKTCFSDILSFELQITDSAQSAFINLPFLLLYVNVNAAESQHSFDTASHMVCSRKLLGEANSYCHLPDTTFFARRLDSRMSERT